MAGLVWDISERKLLESSLQESDRRKDEFLATLAHELRNPLAPLRNGLQIARGTTLPIAAVRARCAAPRTRWTEGGVATRCC